MQIGISVTKKVTFRNTSQEFNNVYHYNLAGAVIAPAQSLLEEVKAGEVAFHSTDVQFVRGAVWSSGGSIAQNQMLFQEALTGTGSQSLATAMDRERAVLVQWPAGIDSRGKPVYLRKWFHSSGACQGHSFTNSELQNTAAIDTASRNTIAAAADSAFTLIGTAGWQLCAESGRLQQAAPMCHAWLEHHQLGDMWR